MSVDTEAFIGYGYIIEDKDFPETIIINGEETYTRDYFDDFNYEIYSYPIDSYYGGSPYFCGIVLAATDEYKSINPFITFLSDKQKENFTKLQNKIKEYLPQVFENQVPGYYLIHRYY